MMTAAISAIGFVLGATLAYVANGYPEYFPAMRYGSQAADWGRQYRVPKADIACVNFVDRQIQADGCHKKNPKRGYALGVGRSLLPHLGF
jgi:hypothetical protein